MKKRKQKIVTIGGGTGSHAVLTGLKKYPVDIRAVVSMADDGGSTGILRSEMNTLPPGDVRQCLVSLSQADKELIDLFNHRFDNKSLRGHNFGNIFLSTLEKIYGDFDKTLEHAGKILKIKGKVLPVSFDEMILVAKLKNGREIIGEDLISQSDLRDLDEMKLREKADINKNLVNEIKNADKIIINPGNLYCSIIPNLLVEGMRETILDSRAEIIYISNLMTNKNHTENFTVSDHVKEIEKYLGRKKINQIIYNTKHVSNGSQNEVEMVKFGNNLDDRYFGADLVLENNFKQKSGDIIERSAIRHDGEKIAKIILDL